MEIPKVMRSCADETNYSLTLKGAVVIVAVYLAHQYGLDVSESEVMILIEALAVIGGSIMTVMGILRKIAYRYASA